MALSRILKVHWGRVDKIVDSYKLMCNWDGTFFSLNGQYFGYKLNVDNEVWFIFNQ